MRVAAVVERLEAIMPLDGPPRRLRDLLEIEFVSHFRIESIKAAELAEQMWRSVSKRIAEKEADANRQGRLARLSIIGSAGDAVVGSCFVRSDEPEPIPRIKAQRLGAEPLLSAIRSLTFQAFERFGAQVLRELGATMVRVTPSSNDQGIDFYGVMNLGQMQSAAAPFFQLARDVQVLFAGQAKHYPKSAIGTAAVRELTGAVALARFNVFSTDIDMFEDLKLKPMAPLVTFLFSTGTLTSGCIELAQSAGIIARSGDQLAVFLADRGVGMRASSGGSAFDIDVFNEWLNLGF